jgi:hypothetical protein
MSRIKHSEYTNLEKASLTYPNNDKTLSTWEKENNIEITYANEFNNKRLHHSYLILKSHLKLYTISPPLAYPPTQVKLLFPHQTIYVHNYY